MFLFHSYEGLTTKRILSRDQNLTNNRRPPFQIAPCKQVKVLKTGRGEATSTLICYVGRTSPGSGQHDAITKVGG